MAEVYNSESLFNRDVRVYGCLYVNDKCGIIFTSPNGTKYSIVATDSGIQFGSVGIGGGSGSSGGGSSVTSSGITIVNTGGDTYNIAATETGVSFQTPDSDGDGEPDNGYVDVTANDITANNITATGIITSTNGFSKVGGGSSEYLMANGSTSRRYVGVGIGSTPGGSGGNTLGNNGDIWYTLC